MKVLRLGRSVMPDEKSFSTCANLFLAAVCRKRRPLAPRNKARILDRDMHRADNITINLRNELWHTDEGRGLKTTTRGTAPHPAFASSNRTHRMVRREEHSWAQAIENYFKKPFATVLPLGSSPSFILCVEGSKIWFEITLAAADDFGMSKPYVSVKGGDIPRADQMLVVKGFEEISDSEN